MPTWRGSDAEDDTDEQVVPDSPYKREIMASKICSYEDAQLPQVIASALHKMACSPRVPIQLTASIPSPYY